VRILLMGSDDFAGSLRGLGLEVLFAGPGGDLALDEPDPPWSTVEKMLQKRGFRPDAVMVCDHVGSRRLPGGMADCDALTVFYGVDSPINQFWQRPYAQLFDLALWDQPQPADDYALVHPASAWLPVGVDPSLYETKPQSNEVNSLAFVGVVEPRVRPKRSAILERLGCRIGLTVRGGRGQGWFPTQQAASLYASHVVTLNENLFPGVTTRPLEVMASGGCLLSEQAPGAMDRCFTDLEHLAYFGPLDLEQKLELVLADQYLRRRLREHGREQVRQKHSLEHRAVQLVKLMRQRLGLTNEQGKARAQGARAVYWEGRALFMAGLRWPERGGRRRMLRGAARLNAAASDSAVPSEQHYWAGLAMTALGNQQAALRHLSGAGGGGGAQETLAWISAAVQAGDAGQASQAARRMGISEQVGDSGFHVEAAQILSAAGREVSPGFNRQPLPFGFWTALEHLVEATRLEPEAAGNWRRLGELLLRNSAPNQAAQALERALKLGSSQAKEPAAQAAREGYL